MKKVALINFLWMLLPLSLSAHPGHGDTDGFSILHYFTEPVHAITTVSLLAFAAILHFRRQSMKSRTKK